MTTHNEKARENRLRGMAQRQGLRISKSRMRDPLGLDYGKWTVSDERRDQADVEVPDLNAVERYLTMRTITRELADAARIRASHVEALRAAADQEGCTDQARESALAMADAMERLPDKILDNYLDAVKGTQLR